MGPQHQIYTPFPYTPLFRSGVRYQAVRPRGAGDLASHTLVPTSSLADQPTAIPQHPPLSLELLLKADRKSTRLNSSHPSISYAVCCLRKKSSFAASWLLNAL